MSGPLDGLLAKLESGQSVVLQVLGDSTAWGVYDAGVGSYVNNVLEPPTLRGWPGRLGILLGQHYNATVNVWSWNYAVNTGYANFVTLYTGAVGSPTITVYDGGWPGGTMTNILGNMPELLLTPNADVVMMYDGYNDNNQGVAASTFASEILTFVNQTLTTYCPHANIIVCTQNGNPSYYAPTWYDVMVQEFLPAQSIPISPPLQSASNNNSANNIWVLDSQQCPLLSTDIAEWVHPNAGGYTKVANWIFQVLVAGSPTSALISTASGVPGVTRTTNLVTLPANWAPGAEFTAADENAVITALNTLSGVLVQLGATVPPTLANSYAAGSIWTAADAELIVTTVNALNATVENLGGKNLLTLPAVGAQWTADNENAVENAVNALSSAVTILANGL